MARPLPLLPRRLIRVCARVLSVHRAQSGARGDGEHTGRVPLVELRWQLRPGLEQLLTPHVEYLALAADEGSRQRAYWRMLDQPDEPGVLAAIRDATNGGMALVGTALKAKLQAESGRPLERRKPGPAPQDKPTLDTLTRELGF